MYVRPGRIICADPISAKRSKKFLKTFQTNKLIIVPVIMDGDEPLKTRFIDNHMHTFRHILDVDNYVIYEKRCAIISFDGIALEIYFDEGQTMTEGFIIYEGDDANVINKDPLKFEELTIKI